MDYTCYSINSLCLTLHICIADYNKNDPIFHPRHTLSVCITIYTPSTMINNIWITKFLNCLLRVIQTSSFLPCPVFWTADNSIYTSTHLHTHTPGSHTPTLTDRWTEREREGKKEREVSLWLCVYDCSWKLICFNFVFWIPISVFSFTDLLNVT